MSAATAPAAAPAIPATAAPTSAASLLSGDGTPAPVAAPVGAPASAVSAVVTTEQQEATRKWVEGIADPALKAYAQAKGWKDTQDLVNGHYHLEKLLGGEKIPMPKGEADKEGWERVYKAVGRPETPEGYKLPAPIQGDKGFSDAAAKIFHEHGLSTRQANGIAKWYSEFGATITAAQADLVQRRNAAQLEQFKAEQGPLFDAKLELGRRAAKQFGFANEELIAFENAFGTKTLLTRFAAIGEALGEHGVSGTGKTGFTLTPAGAKAALDELRLDKEFNKKYLAGDAEAKEKMMGLQAAAAGLTLEEYVISLGTPGRR